MELVIWFDHVCTRRIHESGHLSTSKYYFLIVSFDEIYIDTLKQNSSNIFVFHI